MRGEGKTHLKKGFTDRDASLVRSNSDRVTRGKLHSCQRSPRPPWTSLAIQHTSPGPSSHSDSGKQSCWKGATNSGTERMTLPTRNQRSLVLPGVPEPPEDALQDGTQGRGQHLERSRWLDSYHPNEKPVLLHGFPPWLLQLKSRQVLAVGNGMMRGCKNFLSFGCF